MPTKKHTKGKGAGTGNDPLPPRVMAEYERRLREWDRRGRVIEKGWRSNAN